MNKNNKINWYILVKSAPIVGMVTLSAIAIIAVWLFPSFTSKITERPNLWIWLYVITFTLGGGVAEYEWRKSKALQKGLPITRHTFFDAASVALIQMVGQTLGLLIVAWLAPSWVGMQNLTTTTHPILYMWLFALAACLGYWTKKYAWMKNSINK